MYNTPSGCDYNLLANDPIRLIFAKMNDLGRNIYLIIHMLEPLQTLSPVQLLGISDDQAKSNFFNPYFRIHNYLFSVQLFIHVSLIYLSMVMVIVCAELQMGPQVHQTKH